jgi:hypothetical protein
LKEHVGDGYLIVRFKILEVVGMRDDCAIAYCYPKSRKTFKRLGGHGRRGYLDYGCHGPFHLVTSWTHHDTPIFDDFPPLPGRISVNVDTMPRLTVPYSLEMPIINLGFEGPAGVRSVAGVVDSGADRTLLPKSLAASLGIPSDDLEPGGGAEGAGGVWFPTWETAYALKARVIVPFAQPRGPEPWGPWIEMNPEFATDTIPMFGRADFFTAFTVTFDQPTGNIFHLDYMD